MSDDSEPEARGWDAIDAALLPLYGDQEPLHYAAVLPAMLGGDSYLQGISAYSLTYPEPHWHFVTYGFSELYEKEWSDPAISGFGFELTFRLAKGALTEPPAWAVNFLQNLGRYVYRSGNAFSRGHYMDLNGPIALGASTRIRAIGVCEDPALGPVDTPNGRLSFLQVVGMTLDELEAVKRWNAERVLGLLLQNIQLGITDLIRESVLTIPAVRSAVDAGAASDGSSTGVLYVSAARWERTASGVEVVLGANGVRDLKVVLPGRVPHGRSLSICAGKTQIGFEPASAVSWSEERGDEGEVLTLALSSQAARDLAAVVQAQAGTYAVPSAPGVRCRVEQSLIKNDKGDVVEVVG